MLIVRVARVMSGLEAAYDLECVCGARKRERERKRRLKDVQGVSYDDDEKSFQLFFLVCI